MTINNDSKIGRPNIVHPWIDHDIDSKRSLIRLLPPIPCTIPSDAYARELLKKEKVVHKPPFLEDGHGIKLAQRL